MPLRLNCLLNQSLHLPKQRADSLLNDVSVSEQEQSGRVPDLPRLLSASGNGHELLPQQAACEGFILDVFDLRHDFEAHRWKPICDQ